MQKLYKRISLALLVDFYELTMACGYWKRHLVEDRAVFHLFFRKKPFGGSYAVACGLQDVVEMIQNWHFDEEDLAYLQGKLDPGFLDYLKTLRFTGHIDAMVEGEVAFPYEPMLRVEAPIIEAQLLESALLTLINFPTLIATKASRIVRAARGDEVIEFGLRRAPGVDGAMSASRAAYIGGCTSTSNTLAGKLLGIPVRGTHAHSWVLAFDSEMESFRAWAEAMPDQSIFLVDTYDSLQGVRHAIEVGRYLKSQGKTFQGIRLDSGDIAYLSIQARHLLDQAGFEDAAIVASNELNERLIESLKAQGAQVAIWGVGTHLVTGGDQAALDGVYKLSAYKKQGEEWEYKLKLAERMSKISDPGILQVRRYTAEKHSADAIYDIHTDMNEGCTIVDPFDQIHRKELSKKTSSRDLLVPIFRDGKCVYQSPPLPEIQRYCKEQLALFDKSILRFDNPHVYPVGMEQSLFTKKMELVERESPTHSRSAK